MAMARTALPIAFAAFVGCGTPAPDVVPVAVRIGAADPSCQPSAVRATRLTLEGDFAPAPTDTVELLAAEGVRDLGGLRPSFEALFVEVDGDPSYRAVGRASLEGARVSGVIAVLPPFRSCALVDPDAVAPEGSSVVAHPDGSAWIVGGEGSARRIVRVDPRESFANVQPDALFNPRIGASATLAEQEVIVAGGAAGDGDRAFDTYERLGPDAMPAAAGPGGRLSTARRDHGAVVVGERVILVGGRSGGTDDALVARIDVIDLAAGEGRLGPALGVPRVSPTLVRGADGSLTILGGFDASGARVAAFERIDPSFASVSTLDVDLPAPDLALPLGRDRALHVSAGIVRVIDLVTDPPRVTELSRVSRIVSPVGAVTPAGRALLVGRDASGALRAELWVPHLGTVETLGASRAPSALVWLADGSVLEVGPGGAALRAMDEPGAWTSLPNDRVFVPSDLGTPFVVTGAPGDLEGGRATRSGVTLSLGPLVFGGVTVEVDASGPHRVVLRDDARGMQLEIGIDAEGNAIGPSCESSASPEPLRIARRREMLELVRGAARTRCADLAADGLVSVGVVLERDTTVRAIRASRHPE